MTLLLLLTACNYIQVFRRKYATITSTTTRTTTFPTTPPTTTTTNTSTPICVFASALLSQSACGAASIALPDPQFCQRMGRLATVDSQPGATEWTFEDEAMKVDLTELILSDLADLGI